jgi:hypothetical protein
MRSTSRPSVAQNNRLCLPARAGSAVSQKGTGRLSAAWVQLGLLLLLGLHCPELMNDWRYITRAEFEDLHLTVRAP